MEPGFEAVCKELRDRIRDLGQEVHAQMSHDVFLGEQTSGGQHGEMKANVMLAFRHLEDARMRLGKAIQAATGGVSIYDKAPE